MKSILNQLARNTKLLPEDLSAAILAGNTPPTEEIVLHLVIAGMDAYFVTINDPMASKRERCIAHLGLAATFLSAMAVMGKGEAERQCGVPTATLQDGEL
jgi:hypothetical protein